MIIDDVQALNMKDAIKFKEFLQEVLLISNNKILIANRKVLDYEDIIETVVCLEEPESKQILKILEGKSGRWFSTEEKNELVKSTEFDLNPATKLDDHYFFKILKQHPY